MEAVKTAPMLERADLAILNAARAILTDLEKKASSAAHDDERPARYGRLAEAADTAGDAIFNVLNVANAYGIQKIDNAHLFPPPKARAEP